MNNDVSFRLYDTVQEGTIAVGSYLEMMNLWVEMGESGRYLVEQR